MVTPVPQHQPFNVGAQIGRVGSAIQSAAAAPAQALQTVQSFKANEQSIERNQQEIDKEKQRIADLEERGRRFDEYKKETAVRILGSDEAFSSLFSSADTAKGRLPVDVQGPQPKPTPGTEGLTQSQRDLARKVMEAETKTELGMVMTNASKLINAYESAVQGTGKSVAYAEPNFQELRAYKTGKDKFEMPYADDYIAELDKQKGTFLQEGVRSIIDEKLKNAKPDPITGEPDVSQQEVLQSVFKDPEFNEMAYDKDFVAAVKAGFQDSLASYKAQTGRIQAKKQPAGGPRPPNMELQNQKVLGGIRTEIQKSNEKMNKAVGAEYKALISTGKYLDPAATEKFSEEQKKTLVDQGNKVKELEVKQDISRAASSQGEFLSRGQVDNIYTDIIDGKFDTPLGKQYGPLLGLEQESGGAVTEPVPVEPETPQPETVAPAVLAGPPQKINTQAEYDALPSGTKYIHPDGQIKTKP